MKFMILIYTVQYLLQFFIQPGSKHILALKCVFYYLCRTITFRLTFQEIRNLYIYSNLNWTSDIIDCYSITSYISYFSLAPIF